MTLENLINGPITTVFQPIVELDTGTVVAYEALTRGPAGPLERPDRLFAAARSHGLQAELDERCREAALRNAVAAGLADPLRLFVNIEPETLDVSALDLLIDIADHAPGGLSVVLEITERAIAARPSELLSCVRRLRRAGWQIALDDVGADDMSLAFMPLLRPDVIKLDLTLVQQRPGPEVASVMNAVNAYADRTGAVLLAEGIEHDDHLEVARALGARLGQGWLFGRPSPRLATALPAGAVSLGTVPPPEAEASPFGCLPETTDLRRSTKPLLIELSKHLEREALRHGSTCVVLSTFQYARHFTPKTAERYRELAAEVGFVAAIGEGLPPEPVIGVRGADLDATDVLRDEWDLVVLAPHFAAALLARDLGEDVPDSERHFEFALTYDREVVSAAAEALITRVVPSGPEPATHEAARPATCGSSLRPPALDVGNSAQTKQLLQRALSATTNGVTIADVTRPDHPLIYVNAAFEKLAGLRAEQMVGTNCRFLQGEGTDQEAVARMRSAIAAGRESREVILNYRCGSREPWWNEITLAPIYNDDGVLTQYVGVQNDVTARVEAEAALALERERSAVYLAEMEALAYRDPLTGLLNRRRVLDLLSQSLQRSAGAGTSVGVLYFDLDGFKRVNDGHGHAAGDNVLIAVARRLGLHSGPDDLVARIGGDEFLVVLPDLPLDAAADRTARATSVLRQALAADDAVGAVSASVGCSVYPHDGQDCDALLNVADRRMYADKQTVLLDGAVLG